MTKLILRWGISMAALFAAAWLVEGIRVEGRAWLAYAGMALVLGLVNAIVRPLLKALSCPLILLTLGLFVLVINGITLYLAARISTVMGLGFVVDGFWAAFWGALIVSIVTTVLSVFIPDEEKRD